MRLRESNLIRQTLLLCCLFLLSANRVQAQSVGPFEGEVAAAVSFGAESLGASVDRTWNFVAEGRYNFRVVPVDVGLRFFLGAFGRDWESGISRNQHFKTFSAVADWNFRRTKRVAPFVGCALGVSAVRIDRSDLQGKTREHDCAVCFNPRIGAEFFHRVRLTAGYRLSKRDYRCWEVSLGVVVGGGTRTKRR